MYVNWVYFVKNQGRVFYRGRVCGLREVYCGRGRMLCLCKCASAFSKGWGNCGRLDSNDGMLEGMRGVCAICVYDGRGVLDVCVALCVVCAFVICEVCVYVCG